MQASICFCVSAAAGATDTAMANESAAPASARSPLPLTSPPKRAALIGDRITKCRAPVLVVDRSSQDVGFGGARARESSGLVQHPDAIANAVDEHLHNRRQCAILRGDQAN